jgi:hypothetical protein
MPLAAPWLLDAARAATSPSDFGHPTFRDGLGVLVDSIDREANAHAVGRAAPR